MEEMVASSITVSWGSRVSYLFLDGVVRISNRLGVDPSWLMAIMAFETGQTFSPSIRNKWTGATGLIQFMPQTARALGTSCEQLAEMTAEDQVEYVGRYFSMVGKSYSSIEDLYMAVLWPAAIGKGSDYVIWSPQHKAYGPNKGLDKNKDGRVTVGEAARAVKDMLELGMKDGRSQSVVRHQ